MIEILLKTALNAIQSINQFIPLLNNSEFNSLLKDKFLDLTKLKAFADKKSNVVKLLYFTLI